MNRVDLGEIIIEAITRAQQVRVPDASSLEPICTDAVDAILKLISPEMVAQDVKRGELGLQHEADLFDRAQLISLAGRMALKIGCTVRVGDEAAPGGDGILYIETPQGVISYCYATPQAWMFADFERGGELLDDMHTRSQRNMRAMGAWKPLGAPGRSARFDLGRY